jgi:glutamyl-tRNA reductase
LVSAKVLAQLPKQERERLILDLGVPADTEASIGELPGFKRYDVLDVGSEAETNQVAGRVLQRTIRPYLREGAIHFREKIFRKHLSPVADKLRQSIEERARSEASRWAKTKLAHLDPSDLALFEEFAVRLADLTVQVPLVALRNTLRELPMGDLILERLRQAGRLAAQEERDKASSPLNDEF